MREQTPRIIVSQSDFDMCLKNYPTDEEKAKIEKIKEPYFKFDYPNMEKLLTTFPYKVVADDKYEEELKNSFS
jgi:hypothetical protein